MKLYISFFLLTMTSLSFACRESKFCPGDRVIYTSNDRGTVKEVFSNGKTIIQWDNQAWGSTAINADTLSKAVHCLNKICRNDQVIYTTNDRGQVRELFENGKVAIAWDNTSWGVTVINFDGLAARRQCFQKFCRGNRVLHGSSDTGVILETYTNGKITVDWDNYNEHTTVNHSSLSRAYRCSGNICAGERVMYSTNDTGTLVEIYDNGQAKIRWDNVTWGATIVNFSGLGFELRECWD